MTVRWYYLFFYLYYTKVTLHIDMVSIYNLNIEYKI